MSQQTDTNAPTTTEPAPGLRVQIAAELFAATPTLAEHIAKPPEAGVHSLDYLRRLRLGATPEEAVTFMAYALQPRHAVWWGHECLKATPDLLTEQDKAMLELVVTWVAEQDEDSRCSALEAGQGAGVNGPGSWLTLAIGWSGGSISAQGLPFVPPPVGLMGLAMNVALQSALARVPQDKRRRMLDHYIGMAEVLAKSG
jgi:hypothetical protein